MDIRLYYCIWLKDHLGKYDYHTPEAKELRQRFEKISFDSSESPGDSNREAEKCYEEFWRLLDNNPVDYELNLNNEKVSHITPKKLEYYFVDDSGDCYIPIALYKEISGRQPERVVEAVNTFISKISEETNRKIDKLKRREKEKFDEVKENYENNIKLIDSPSFYQGFFALIMSVVSAYALYRIYIENPDLFRKEGLGFWSVIYFALAIAVLVFTCHGIGEIIDYYRMCRWNNAIKMENEETQDYFGLVRESLNKKYAYLIEYIQKPLDEKGKNTSEEGVVSNSQKELDINRKYDKLQELKDDTKALRTRWSWKKILVYLLIVLILVNNSNMYSVPVINRIGDFGKSVAGFKMPEFHPVAAIGDWLRGIFDGDSESQDDNDAEQENEESFSLVLAIDSNLRSEPNPDDSDNIIAVIDSGTIIDEVLDVKEDVENGTKWLQVKVKGKTGWMSRKVLKLNNPKEFSYKKIAASSELTVQGTKMVAQKAFDGYMQTTWQEAAKGDGRGEWISVTLDHKGTVDYIIFHNGHLKSKESYYNNNRIKTMTVETDEGKYTFTLEDIYEIEGFRLDFDSEVNTQNLKFIIDEVYLGEKSNDTCISSIQVFEK